MVARDAVDFVLRAEEHGDTLVQAFRLYIQNPLLAIGRGAPGRGAQPCGGVVNSVPRLA